MQHKFLFCSVTSMSIHAVLKKCQLPVNFHTFHFFQKISSREPTETCPEQTLKVTTRFFQASLSLSRNLTMTFPYPLEPSPGPALIILLTIYHPSFWAELFWFHKLSLNYSRSSMQITYWVALVVCDKLLFTFAWEFRHVNQTRAGNGTAILVSTIVCHRPIGPPCRMEKSQDHTYRLRGLDQLNQIKAHRRTPTSMKIWPPSPNHVT